MEASPLIRHNNQLNVVGDALVSLSEAKSQVQLPVDVTFDDDYLNTLIEAATGFVYSRGAVGNNDQYTLGLWSFPQLRCAITFPIQPVSGVVSVQYTDDSNNPQTFTDWVLTKTGSKNVLMPAPGMTWPELTESYPDRVNIKYTVAAEQWRSAMAKLAILQLVAHWYETRQTVVTGTIATEVPVATMDLIKRIQFGNEFEVYGV